MSVTVPSNDKKNIEKANEVTALATAIAAQTAGPSLDALKQRQIQVNAELVTTLMHSGKLSPLTILSTCTYGT